jgi:circadian clock protein KaiC
VLLDTLEALFSSFGNQAILRAEIRRIFRWLKDRGVTTVITAERGTDTLTRHGLEEYVSDCVILLDHRVQDEVSTRRLRVVKYRGSYHGTNEYPFLIDESGISVLPVTSFGLQHRVGTQRLSTGIADLDEMLEGKGYFRGSTVLVSGTAGSGKTTIATHFINAACARGERCLYLSLEESPSQIVRNVTSVGVKLGPAIDKGLLLIQGTRPTEFGLEMHLMRFHKILAEFKPRAVVVDPITNLGATAGEFKEIRSMLMRLIDYLKSQQITALFTSLTSGGHDAEQSEVGVSSLIDTWLLLRELESSGERNRILYIVKSRGMAHSNQVREFVMTSQGVKLVPVYLGTSGVLTGSARIAQEAREREEKFTRELETRQYREQLERKRQALEARIAALRAEFAAEEREVARTIELQREREQRFVDDRSAMARSRRAPSDKHGKNGRLAAAGGDY